jgi:hypothetical protein
MGLPASGVCNALFVWYCRRWWCGKLGMLLPMQASLQ